MRAVCTWGEGPDVLLVLDGSEVMLYHEPYHHKPPRGDSVHGYVSDGSACLTASEALKLAYQLVEAVGMCKELEEDLEYYI